MRDTQKQRVYSSELRGGRTFQSVGEMQDYCDRLTESAWWRKNVRRPSRVMVHDGRGRRSANGSRDLWGIGHVKMPKWARTETTLLHEITHTIAPNYEHGPEYAGIYLTLLRRQLGHDFAKQQMQAFRDHRSENGRAAPVDWKLPTWYPKAR